MAIPLLFTSRPRRAVPFPFDSSGLDSIPCPFGSFRLRSPRFRCRSLQHLSQRLHALSVLISSYRVAAAPSLIVSSLSRAIAKPFQLGSTRIDATPSQLLAVLVAAGQRGSMSIRLKQSRAEHLHCISGPCDSKPLTSKPWQFIYALRRSVPCWFASLPLNSALLRFVAIPRPSCRGVSEPLLLASAPVGSQLLTAVSDQSRAWPLRSDSSRLRADHHVSVAPPRRAIRISSAQRRCHALPVKSTPCPRGSALLIVAYAW